MKNSTRATTKCACGCGGVVIVHKNHGRIVRFLHGHNARTPDGIAHARRNIKKYFSSWNRSAEGKRFLERAGRRLGRKWGRRNGVRNWSLRLASDAEKIMVRHLKQWKIKFEWNKKTFSVKPGKGGGYYQIDFFLPKYEIALEIDGYKSRQRRKRDLRRDSLLSKVFGVKTVRIKNKDVIDMTKSRLLSELRYA